MSGNPPVACRARVLLPVAHPAIEDGVVVIRRGRIQFAGAWKNLPPDFDGPVMDLGESVILPGLVNAHCHLDYTNMAGQISPPHSFLRWIEAIVALKASWGYTDYAESWLNGALQLLRTGTTTVGDIEAVPELLPDVTDETPLRVISFLELISVKRRRRPATLVREAAAVIRSLPKSRPGAGLSPHALYTTSADLLDLARRVARRNRWRLTMHVAESETEFEMFQQGRGAMFDWLRRNGRNMSDCGHSSPVQRLEELGLLGPEFLAVHANCLAAGDADLLARRGVSVAHCPRSHRFFKHPPFPLAALQAAGVNLCLGTDSLASVARERSRKPALSLLAEMSELAHREPGLRPDDILRLATVNGARALGLRQQVGELSPGSRADLVVMRIRTSPREATEAVVHHDGDAAGVMIGGQWVISPEPSI